MGLNLISWPPKPGRPGPPTRKDQHKLAETIELHGIPAVGFGGSLLQDFPALAGKNREDTLHKTCAHSESPTLLPPRTPCQPL
ncbi:MAG: hypothetical protein CMJ62_06670 [Planctomycetaceae bacterium]|nr:hypothetical protein [Planctomycetaceae bacterium]